MVPQCFGFYFILDQYFIDFPDPFLKGNKKEKRPCYCCFQDPRNNLFWMIPLSSQQQKIMLAKKKIQEGKADIFHLTEIGGVPGVMLIADMFPVTPSYIAGAYTWDGLPLIFKDTTEIAVIMKKSKKILALLRRGTRFTSTQPDVLNIEKKLLE